MRSPDVAGCTRRNLRIAVAVLAVGQAIALGVSMRALPRDADVRLTRRSSVAPVSASVRVTVDAGTLEGRIQDDVVAFKGIPYAAPPTGDRRWRPPQPVSPWRGVRPAREYGHDCPQKPIASDAAPLGAVPAEDCLVLNVWRPLQVHREAALPVLVWIHGGGYVNGGSSAAIYDGSGFASVGLVVVSFNYRLGRLGYFAHPALLREAPGEVGNYGYMDQRAALAWVQRNVAAFGGDPRQVTIAGESAGGASVLDLLASAPDEGLFARAVVMSGGGRSHLLGGRALRGGTRARRSADDIGVAFAHSVGVRGEGPDALAQLRALPVDQVVGNLNMVGLFVRTVLPLGRLKYAEGPIVDGTLVRDAPGTILHAGQGARVPLLIGTTDADLSTWFPRSTREVFAFFGPEAAAARAVYDPGHGADKKTLVALVGGDRTMQEPARFAARAVTRSGAPVWLYRFGYVAGAEGDAARGAAHASELPFMFDTLDARFGRAVTPRDREAAKVFHRYIATFASTGDPNAPGLPRWPRLAPGDEALMQFTRDGTAVWAPDPWRERLDLAERAADRQVR